MAYEKDNVTEIHQDHKRILPSQKEESLTYEYITGKKEA